MATDEHKLRDHILAQAVKSIPRPFLEEFQDRTRRAYKDVYAEVSLNKTTLPEQRLFKLVQDRCFRIDWDLYKSAEAHGLSVSAKPLPSNRWHHVYTTSGDFGLTQSYVQCIGDIPQPARFREALAEAARCPRLPLDDPSDIYSVKNFYALLAHNPRGRKFSEDDQTLGSLMFCVPDRTMKSWAVEISIPELVAYYPFESEAPKKDRGPTWRRKDEDRGTGTK